MAGVRLISFDHDHSPALHHGDVTDAAVRDQVLEVVIKLKLSEMYFFTSV